MTKRPNSPIEEEVAQEWKEIAEQHRKEKAAQEARKEQEKQKGKSKMQEEPFVPDEPKLEMH